MNLLKEIKKGKEGNDRLFALSVPKTLSISIQRQPSAELGFAFEAVSLSELLYPSCCVDEFLLSGKERVTVGTDIDMDVADGRTGLHCEATSTDHLRLLVLWMDAFFHNYLTIVPVYNIRK